jgi:uncharacterized protein YaaW (UPF0174 family)
MFLADVLRQLELEEHWCDKEHSRLSGELSYLEKPAYEHMAPEKIVALGSDQERKALQEISGATSVDAKALVDALRDVGSNGLAQFVRMFTRDDVSVCYQEILWDACKHVGLRPPKEAGIYSLEVQLQRQAFTRLLESMPAENRQRFLRELSSQTQEPALSKEAVLGGGIVVANLSGFGLYLASSTALGAITSAIGVTLPFAVYTGMSSTIALLIGPIGWVALGTWVIHKLGKPNPNKVLAGTLLIANIRQRLISIRDKPVPRIKNDRDVVLAKHRAELKLIKAKARAAAKYALSSSEPVDGSAYATPLRPKLYCRHEADTESVGVTVSTSQLPVVPVS